MCLGISISWRELQDTLIEQYALHDRIITRQPDAEREIRFLYRDPTPQLPAWHDNQLDIFLWGNRDDRNSRLPRTGWCRSESLEAGRWRHWHPEPVLIPANFGLAKGVWFHLTEGINGILVRDEKRRPHIYMLTQPATRYFEVMTQDARMPLLINQSI